MYGKFLIVVVVAAVALTGCVIVIDGAKGGSVDVATSFDSGGGEIARSVRDAYLVEPVLRDADLRVRAKDGVVTVRGNVADAAQAERAIAIAQQTPGVVRVVSRLSIGG